MLSFNTVSRHLGYQKPYIHIVVFGIGGTGSNFTIKLFKLLFAAQQKYPTYTFKVTLIDGDHVDQGNLRRQHFCEEDLMSNKAEVFYERYNGHYPFDIRYIDRYVENAEEALSIMEFGREDIPIIIGAVDNLSTRQILHQAFDELETCFYIDAGNISKPNGEGNQSNGIYQNSPYESFATGQVCMGFRYNGDIVLPPIGHFRPNFLTEKDRFKSDIGCGEEVGGEQTLVANDFASANLLVFLHQLLIERRLWTHFVTFDGLSGLSSARWVEEWFKQNP